MRTTGDMRETILQQARQLFVEQGYAATSIKQIAKAAGCATSALYYYFEEGKPQILRGVVRASTDDTLQLVERVQEATSLADLLQRFGETILNSMPELITNSSWLQMEFVRLPEEEKQYVQTMFTTLHRFLSSQIARFVQPEDQAAKLAWMLVCTYIGYEQLFVRLEMARKSAMRPEEFSTFTTDTLAREVQEPS